MLTGLCYVQGNSLNNEIEDDAPPMTRQGYLTFYRPPPPLTLTTLMAKINESDIPQSYLTKGWYPVTASIREGELLKVYGDGIKIDARFKVLNSIQDGENGDYKIKGGTFAGAGHFRSVSEKKSNDFTRFFVCNSTTLQGVELIWEVGVNKIFDPDTASAD